MLISPPSPMSRGSRLMGLVRSRHLPCLRLARSPAKSRLRNPAQPATSSTPDTELESVIVEAKRRKQRIDQQVSDSCIR